MKHPSNALAGATFASRAIAVTADAVSQIREDWRQARAAQADLLAMGMPRVNLLFSGKAAVIENVLEALFPHLREPIGRWRPGEQLLLPPPALIGTMIFQDIDGMPPYDQSRLADWLEGAAGRTQVVSTSSASLFPHVETGHFLDTLYYRLNTICMDLND
jgi:hypothetical protein